VFRNVVFLALISLLGVPAAHGQEWAKKLFKTHKHDFGTVARGAKIEYEFEMVNCFVEDVHIASVRTSCGCTTPSIKKKTLKTWEKGAIVAKLNTRAFMGYKSAAIIVTIDKPYYAEVQLSVQSRIRSDVVLNPGVVQYGSVDQGNVAEQTIKVEYAGRNDWQIVDVRSANTHFEVELTETQRGGGRVSYEMLVRLKNDARPGYINDQLTVVTNDRQSRTIPLPVEGRVLSAVTVSPKSLSLGLLAPGQKVTKQLVVRGKKPFRVTNVQCKGDGDCFEFKKPTEVKTLQFIPVTFTAGDTPGPVVRTIEIETDLTKGPTEKCIATATIRAPENGGNGETEQP